MDNLMQKMQEASDFIKSKTRISPQVGFILGSGLGELADDIENAVLIDYSSIPHFPASTVKGHAGKLVLGKLEGKSIVALKGRLHFYEGYSMQEITFPVRVMKAIGINSLIVTNACGGINQNFNPGDLMIIEDHINLMGSNPLIGKNIPELGQRFPDMSGCYDPDYVKLAQEVANKAGIDIKKGVYVAVSGPNYETMAELNFLRIIGADAVGMSTVPEVIVAAHASLKTLGISCVTDVIFKKHDHSVSHDEVIEVARRVKPTFIKLIKEIIKRL